MSRRPSNTYRLVDDGYPVFKKIVRGGKWVGRVVRCADGRFYARINNARGPATEFYAATEIEAFEQVAAVQLGYANAGEVRAHNSDVRAANRDRNAYARGLADRFRRGDLTEKIAVVDELLGLAPKGDSK
jgi:hypothetical protein